MNIYIPLYGGCLVEKHLDVNEGKLFVKSPALEKAPGLA